MKKEREVPTVKCAVLALCFSILALMSACAAAPAEAAGAQTEQIAAMETTTKNEKADTHVAEVEETVTSEEAEEPAALVYDTSMQYNAAALADGDEILGGTYIAEGSVSVTMDAASTWTLTGDSYITSLSGNLSGLNLNGYSLYVNGAVWKA